MNQNEKIKLYETMKIYGGSFVQALAECVVRADKINLSILQNSFPNYFEKYGKDGIFQKEKK